MTPETFQYPFGEFPTIVSHIHPCFVLCHSTQLFRESARIHGNFLTDENLGYEPIFDGMMQVFKHWTAAIPANSIFYFRDPSLPDDDSYQSSIETINERVNWQAWSRYVEGEPPSWMHYHTEHFRRCRGAIDSMKDVDDGAPRGTEGINRPGRIPEGKQGDVDDGAPRGTGGIRPGRIPEGKQGFLKRWLSNLPGETLDDLEPTALATRKKLNESDI